MLDIRLVTDTAGAEVLVLPVRPSTVNPAAGGEIVPTAASLDPGLTDEAAALVELAEFSGAAGSTHLTIRPTGAPTRLLLVGVGAGDEAGWRAAGAALVRAATGSAPVTIALPAGADPAVLRGVAEGAWLASYRFRLAPESPRTGASELRLVVVDPAAYEPTLAAARVTADATWFARDLTNMPSSAKGPEWFADQVRERAGVLPGVTVEVRDREWLAREGFGGLLAVGDGSARPPRLVELAWRPDGARTHVVLVGKGITFDTGGISIKPRDAMKLMRKDMGGAAAVVAATLGAAALRLPVRVTALAPLAENMVSGSAFRPGDVVRHYGGLTSETTNSDAEGRLVLADAMAYAVDRLAPDLLIDLATLTGANAVALGKRTAALYSANDELAGAVLAAAEAAGERAWRMPLPEDYVEYLHSDIADLYSVPTQGAGSVLAALYLREFTGELRDDWLHLDMSAPSWAEANDGELVKGATGWGVRTLLRWLAELAPAGSALDGDE